MAIKPSILQSWGPGGWSFYEPATDWHAPGPLENTFNQQVKNIIAMRKANPRFNLPTDEPTVAAELEAYTEARWAKIYSRRGMEKFIVGAPDVSVKKKESSIMPSSNNPLRVVAAAAGVDTRSLEEWLGEGGIPVAAELAERRATICAGHPEKHCPANQKSGWRELLTVPAATAVKKYLEHKHRMKLVTSLDGEMGSCQACHCVLPLKVWQPIKHIKDNTTPETLERHRHANPNCWVLSESAA